MKRNERPAGRRAAGWLAMVVLLLLALSACASAGGQTAIEDSSNSAAVTEGQTPEGDWFRGDPNAPITLIEYSDYQCPFCSRHVAQTAPLLDDQYVRKGLVKHVFKDFPLTSIHPQAFKAAEAARCAGDQDQYWAMHDKLFALQQVWSGKDEAPDIFKQYAADLGLDAAVFAACLDSGKYVNKVNQGLQEGVQQGVKGTPAFFVDAWFVSGAQPFEVFQQIIAKAQAGETPAPTPTPLPAGIDPLGPDPSHPGLTYAGFYYKGSEDAPILIVEFSDLQCPYCLQHFQQVQPLLDKEWIEKGQVRLVFVPFPLAIHPQAPKAHEAAECAGVQGKFWELHDLIFSKQQEWSGKAQAPEIFKTYANELGLDSGQFDACLDSGQMESKVEQGLALGEQAQVRGTPNFFLIKNGQGTRIPGALPYEQFNQALNELLTGKAETPPTQ